MNKLKPKYAVLIDGVMHFFNNAKEAYAKGLETGNQVIVYYE